jgi:ribosomal protein S27AE
MSLNPLTLLEKAINEHGSSVILGHHLSLVKEMLSKTEKEKRDLEKLLSDAREEIIELKKKIPNSKFVEYRGAKFKRRPSGGYENSVYCPSCEAGMATISSGNTPFVCGKCHALTTFRSHDLASVLKEIAIEYP